MRRLFLSLLFMFGSLQSAEPSELPMAASSSWIMATSAPVPPGAATTPAQPESPALIWGGAADGLPFLSRRALTVALRADISEFQKHLRLELEAICDAAGLPQANTSAASSNI